MGKVLGAIFTIVGGLITLFTVFLVYNTNAYMQYHPDDKALHVFDTGYAIPGFGGLFLLIAGIVFLVASDER